MIGGPHLLRCRHLREEGAESWGFYLHGPLPGCLRDERTTIGRGEQALATLTAPSVYDENDPRSETDVPDDGLLHWRLEVMDPRSGGEGRLASRRYIPAGYTMATEAVLDMARVKAWELLLLLEDRTRVMREEVGRG